MASQTLMKNGLGASAVERITQGLVAAGADISEEKFRRDCLNTLDKLELKDRVLHLISVMAIHLPDSFSETADIFGRIRDHWGDGAEDDQFQVFAAWPIIDYVGIHGLEQPDIALPLLRYLTPMFSAEFAVRPFLERHPKITYNTMLEWCHDPNEHARRLASEGIRPRLPWGKQLATYISNPSPVIDLLEHLKEDSSEYVRRSVANNLNDISKDHPDLVIKTCRRWLADLEVGQEINWIVRHATRTLVKAGNSQVFPLLGYTSSPKITATEIALASPSINLGESLHLSTKITSNSAEKQSIVVDYAIHFMKANGKTAPKVFKWKNLHLAPGQTIVLEKKHSIKLISTRRYYSGSQSIELLINGVGVSKTTFNLHC